MYNRTKHLENPNLTQYGVICKHSLGHFLFICECELQLSSPKELERHIERYHRDKIISKGKSTMTSNNGHGSGKMKLRHNRNNNNYYDYDMDEREYMKMMMKPEHGYAKQSAGRKGAKQYNGRNGANPYDGRNGANPYDGRNDANPYDGQNGVNDKQHRKITLSCDQVCLKHFIFLLL